MTLHNATVEASYDCCLVFSSLTLKTTSGVSLLHHTFWNQTDTAEEW